MEISRFQNLLRQVSAEFEHLQAQNAELQDRIGVGATSRGGGHATSSARSRISCADGPQKVEQRRPSLRAAPQQHRHLCREMKELQERSVELTQEIRAELSEEFGQLCEEASNGGAPPEQKAVAGVDPEGISFVAKVEQAIHGRSMSKGSASEDGSHGKPHRKVSSEDGSQVTEGQQNAMSQRSFKLQKQATVGPVGQFRSNPLDQGHARAHDERKPWTLRSVVTSFQFDLTFAFLILANTLVMAAEVQYRGFDIGMLVEYPGMDMPARDAWPEAQNWFDTLEIAFGVLFTFEVTIKIVGLRREFFKTLWNCFDFLIVVLWLAEKVANASMLLNPLVLRVLRLLRLVRLARMVKTISTFDSLHVLVGSIYASMGVLLWASILLLLVQAMIALFLCSTLEDFMKDPSFPLQERREVFVYFGTFSRSMITMFELTLANWIVPCRLLMTNVHEWWGLFVLVYKLAVGFSVVNVITGVFLHETFNVASSDDDLMVVQRARAQKKLKAQMKSFLDQADVSRDGSIQREEFVDILKGEKMQTWLAAMEIEAGDSDTLFNFIDNGDERISAEELTHGVARLRGAARSIDLTALTYRMTNMEELLEEIAESLHK